MMSSRAQLFELSKLRVLQLLSEPGNREYGVVESRISRDACPEQLVTLSKLLTDILQCGLAERRQDTRDSTAKPYFITPDGITYLKAAQDNAMFPEIGQTKHWATDKAVLGDLHMHIAGIIRGLPEFQGRGEERVRLISQHLVDAVSEFAKRRQR